MGACSFTAIKRDEYERDPIWVIDFELLKLLPSFPRFPENMNFCVDVASLDRSESFVVFISHNWLRSHENAPDWDGRPHPDNATHDKFKLCVEGIEKTMKYYAPGAKQCYVWIDFGCINQDINPAGELNRLDEIMRNSDCIFTPIHGENLNEAPVLKNIYDDYRAAAWNEGPFSYTERAWCRVEMLYAANIPLIEDKARAERCFRHGFKSHILIGFRPHLLYGTSESKSRLNPRVLDPLNNSFYEKLNPLRGKISFPSDEVKIEELYQQLKPYLKSKVAKVGYEGSYDDKGRMSGKGVYGWENGDCFDGDWLCDKQNGKGVFNYASGDVYEGDWKDGKQNGKGTSRWADGRRYEGDWVDGNMHGAKGFFRFANGNIFEGNFVENKMTTGKMFLADVNLNFDAVFSGGDDMVMRQRVYRLVLKNPNGSLYKECDFSNGNFVLQLKI